MPASPRAAREILALIGPDCESASDAEDAMGHTDCPEGCVVEPDGHCPHGYESAALTLGVI